MLQPAFAGHSTALPDEPAGHPALAVETTGVVPAESLKLFSDPAWLQLLKMQAPNAGQNVHAMCSEIDPSQHAVSHRLHCFETPE